MVTMQSLLERCAFPDSSHIFCAVSGGPDSLALLALACASGREVTAVHVDHGLRPTSDDDGLVVAAAAQRFGADFLSEKVVIEPGANLEARARAARYSVLPAGVLTGHTADDQAETVLLNLMRGSGLAGLGGMNIAQRPLLRIRRAETHALCAELKLDPIVDESNASNEFRRNRVRAELLPLLDVIAERDVAAVIARQTESLQADEAFLQTLAAELDPTDARQIAAAPKPLASRAIRSWLRAEMDDEMHPPDAAAIERVLDVAAGRSKGCDVANGISVGRTNQRLYLHLKG